MLLSLLTALSLAAAPTSTLQDTALASRTRTLMPVPRVLEWHEGRLAVDDRFRVAVYSGSGNARLDRAIRRMLARLRSRTALALSATPDSAGSLMISVGSAGQAVQGVDEDESYRLDIAPTGALLSAPTTVGAIRGLESFLQLLGSDPSGFFVPAVRIDDAPRFPWRGLLVDAGRHFMPVEVIERTLDGMAAVKLNVLHWHLSEDQGFRVESHRFPLLQERGSDSLFYTQVQIRAVVAYARDRGIRVVPEFDMPGHSQSWFVGYPQYSAGPGPYAIERGFGVFDPVFDPTREAVYRFIDRFIGEMAPLFPDAYWHIGGDEVNGRQWSANPAIGAFKQRHGLADNDALQAYFNQRLIRILEKHGKRMIGWDEILHEGLPPNTVVQSWRGPQYLGQAAKRGFGGILSAPYYLDHQESAQDHYLPDPLPATTDLTAEQQRLVLGGEACMWAEHVTAETVDSRIWPRLAAVAERFWSPREVNDVGDMYRRLRITSVRLEELGLQHEGHTARMLRRIDGPQADVLADFLGLVEPATFGQRSQLQHPTQLVPLTGIVDAARPDPPGRWDTEQLVTRLLGERSGAAAGSPLQAAFLAWIFSASRAQEAIGAARTASDDDASPVLDQLLPAAVVADSVARLGITALRWLGQRPPAESTAAALAALQRWGQPQGLLRVWGVGPVKRLIQAVGVR